MAKKVEIGTPIARQWYVPGPSCLLFRFGWPQGRRVGRVSARRSGGGVIAELRRCGKHVVPVARGVGQPENQCFAGGPGNVWTLTVAFGEPGAMPDSAPRIHSDVLTKISMSEEPTDSLPNHFHTRYPNIPSPRPSPTPLRGTEAQMGAFLCNCIEVRNDGRGFAGVLYR